MWRAFCHPYHRCGVGIAAVHRTALIVANGVAAEFNRGRLTRLRVKTLQRRNHATVDEGQVALLLFRPPNGSSFDSLHRSDTGIIAL